MLDHCLLLEIETQAKADFVTCVPAAVCQVTSVDNRDADTDISISGPVIRVSVMSDSSPSVRAAAADTIATASFVEAAAAVGSASIPAVVVGSVLPTISNPYKVGRPCRSNRLAFFVMV